MKLRTLSILLFTGGAVVLVGSVALFGALSWLYLKPFLPEVVSLGGVVIPPVTILLSFGALLVFVIALAIISCTVALTRVVVQPLTELAAAMKAATYSLPQTTPHITELRELWESFRALLAQVTATHTRDTEMSRVKSDFISTAAHQLRTPLTGIRWALEALSKEPLTESQQALVLSAQSKGKDLVATVGTLLDISSIESGKHPYVFTSVHLPELAAAVVQDLAPLAAERGVVLTLDPADPGLPRANADRQQITWVLTNLIENAIRYTPATGAVRVSFASRARNILVIVRDTGIGIPDGDRDNIFERFYRAGNAISKENAGNGLGLYIARTIASDHGGDLTFSPNNPDPGTTFTLTLPPA
jgi:signal transduction histidine kinase